MADPRWRTKQTELHVFEQKFVLRDFCIFLQILDQISKIQNVESKMAVRNYNFNVLHTNKSISTFLSLTI